MCKTRLIKTILILGTCVLPPFIHAETSPKNSSTQTKPASSSNDTSHMMKCPHAKMKDGNCPQNGMKHEHMQHMHSQPQDSSTKTNPPASTDDSHATHK